MVNEVVQWAVLAGVVFLMLGVLRQQFLLMPNEARAVGNGPSPGKPLPHETFMAARDVLRAEGEGRGESDLLLGFVTESCPGCRQLVANIAAAVDRGTLADVVLIARAPSDHYLLALSQAGIPTLADSSSRHWNACEVTATPLVVRVGADGLVKSREVAHRVDEISLVEA
jgi:hypothetical protein